MDTVIADPLAINSTAATTTATATATEATTVVTFEDKLRQEVLLIPEDIQDIHIQAPSQGSSTADAGASASAGVCDIAAVAGAADDDDSTTPANNTRYGKGKHWKKNMKKKQAATTTIPIQTERTIEQRRDQIRPIIDKLTELQMNVSYPAIRELYKQLSQFVRTGEDAKIKIAFPEFSRKIKGELSNAPYIPCWVKLEME